MASKTITLTKAEAKAWAAGERVMWRRMRKQPHPTVCMVRQTVIGEWDFWGPAFNDGKRLLFECGIACPYGKRGNTVGLRGNGMSGKHAWGQYATIAAIRVANRGDIWGWEMELEELRNG